MRIVGIENMTADQLKAELQIGGKFVVFYYCISIAVMTFKRPSAIYFVKFGENLTGKAAGFSAISALLGWWGIPWGPIWTISTIVTNLRGGKDVTAEVAASLNPSPTPQPMVAS